MNEQSGPPPQQGGVHPKVVQERLGDNRLDITLDIYSHVLPGMQKPAAAAMDCLLGPNAIPG